MVANDILGVVQDLKYSACLVIVEEHLHVSMTSCKEYLVAGLIILSQRAHLGTLRCTGTRIIRTRPTSRTSSCQSYGLSASYVAHATGSAFRTSPTADRTRTAGTSTTTSQVSTRLRNHIAAVTGAAAAHLLARVLHLIIYETLGRFLAEQNHICRHLIYIAQGRQSLNRHATGHLIYSRFWNKFLFDLGVSKKEEPFQKLINQGMIQGWSSFVYRLKGTQKYVSFDLLDVQYDDAAKKNRYFYQGTEADPIYTDISTVKNGNQLDIDKFRAWMPEFKEAEIVTNEAGHYIISQSIEKMSKSKYNVVNPDDICEHYGADTLRLYEMFLGPIEQSKPWDVAGIDGCFRFLKKFWSLYWGKDGQLQVSDTEPTAENMKSLHKLIKKVSADIEEFSYNTSISAFMVATSELAQQKCNSRQVLEPLAILIAPFCPHIAEELWEAMGHTTTVCDAQWPVYDEKYLVETSVKLGVQFNGKVRFAMDFPANATPEEMVAMATSAPEAQKYLDGMQVVKTIAIPGRIVNIVIKPQG